MPICSKCGTEAAEGVNFCGKCGTALSSQGIIKLAEQGDDNAQTLLGLNYEEGTDTPKDPEKAAYWYTKAAENGNKIAQLKIGFCYAEGEGVKQDFEKANHWLTKAAGQGNDEAQEALKQLPELKKSFQQQNEPTQQGNAIIVPCTRLWAKMVWLQSNAKSHNTYIIEISTDEIINTKFINNISGIATDITIILKGTDKAQTITISHDSSSFSVRPGITLILDNNITLRGRNDNIMPLVIVRGFLIMKSGSAITGNNNTNGPGGGVSVGEGGIFTMEGGKIFDNTCVKYGGGVAVSGIFDMKGGIISGNTTQFGGGGVAVDNSGIFTMSGGTISSNTVNSGGGGVCVVGEFNMSDGTICENTAKKGLGGGVYVTGYIYLSDIVLGTGIFTMSGGIITNNRASDSGGGVYMDTGTSKMVFNKTGGIITSYINDMENGNVVTNSSAEIISGHGHAVYVNRPSTGPSTGSNYYSDKFIDTTVDSTESISYNGENNTFDGRWKSEVNPSNKCYVATCVYGSYDCPEVWTLRRYRDGKLSNTCFGRQFIRVYYAVSPKIVELFGNGKWFNGLCKPILNKFVRALQNSGVDSSPYSDM